MQSNAVPSGIVSFGFGSEELATITTVTEQTKFVCSFKSKTRCRKHTNLQRLSSFFLQCSTSCVLRASNVEVKPGESGRCLVLSDSHV